MAGGVRSQQQEKLISIHRPGRTWPDVSTQIVLCRLHVRERLLPRGLECRGGIGRSREFPSRNQRFGVQWPSGCDLSRALPERDLPGSWISPGVPQPALSGSAASHRKCIPPPGQCAPRTPERSTVWGDALNFHCASVRAIDTRQHHLAGLLELLNQIGALRLIHCSAARPGKQCRQQAEGQEFPHTTFSLVSEDAVSKR